MASRSSKDDIQSSLKNLSLSPNASAKSKAKSKEDLADSWEDEDASDEGLEEPRSPVAGTSAPPPTPITATYSHDPTSASAVPRRGDNTLDEKRRPEKTDAVARRMIAAGLGLKAPKQTEEQKAYQRAVREQEKKKREQEKAEEARRQEETAKAKAAIWDD
ncbi:hypothetical protein NLU13_0744 [Sarocladium strictum]|uniref:Uncharacterized protein n=1 Tax=Sarocladium strictum TaxID=5046 RepID=A0AA39GR35_SARSR|nr:hypothetical protein NLU13_0744 [Sarocladium strictum]